MMADTKHDFTFDLNHVFKFRYVVKKEMEETDLLTQPSEEQDFKVSMIKIEKADGDNSKLHSQQSENFAENFGDQKNTLKQEEEITHFTDRNKSQSLASRLLAMSEKANNSHCVPIIMPKSETFRDTPVPEVSLSQVQFIEEDEEIFSKNYELAKNMQDQLEYHHSEQILRKEIDFQKSFQCQICLKEFSQFSHLKNHQLTHTSLKNIRRLICQRGFSTSSELKKHKLGDVGEENDITKVQFREEEKEMTLGKSVLTDNMQDQSEQYQPNETVLSTEVNFVSSYETNRNQHQIGLKEFTRPLHLNTHQPIHKTFKCLICRIEFSQFSSLKTHQMIHTDEKKFKCPTCQKNFRRKADLKRHQRIHASKKPLKCHICQREFCYSKNFENHLLRHTLKKTTFKCQICLKEYSASSSLKSHQMIHTDDNKFKCQNCQKSFWKKSELKSHQMIHTDEKTFKCHICQEQDFKVSMIKIEKADGDNSKLHSQQSENFAENFGDQKNILKQEEEITHFTDRNKSQSLASRLLAMSEKANNSHCVPIIMPKSETLRDTPVPEVSLSQVQFIEEDEEIFSKNYELAENMQDQLEYHHSEQILRKEIDFQKSFQCQICLKEFSQFSHLKNHQLTHTGLKNIRRLICQRGFSTSSELKRHKLGDVGEENDITKVQFREEEKEMTLGKSVLTDNMQDQPEQYQPNETVLSTEVNFVSSYETNRNQHQIGLKEFTRPLHLNTHQPIHKTFKCLICRIEFSQFSSLKTHQMIHTDEKKFKCPTCQKIFRRKADLKRHQRIHTSKKPLKCHICQQKFCFSKNFENHLLRHTLKKNTFKCQICLKEYSASSSLKSHQMIHTDDNKFKCQNCQKSFWKKSELKSHQMIHTDEKTFKCHICQREFSYSRYLKAHLRRHTATCEKAFECQICLSEFSYSRTLKSHMLRHTGTCEGTFKCLICRSEFSQFSSLKTHQMIHTDEKKFKCQTCQKCFWRKADLKRHQMIHTGEKTFKCRICPKKFSSSSYLKIHQLIHTDCPVA